MSVNQSTSSYLVSSSRTFCVYSSRCLARFGDVICTVALFRKKSTAGSLCGNGTVAKRPRLSRATRGRSGDHEDDVEAVQFKFKFKFKFILHAESVPHAVEDVDFYFKNDVVERDQRHVK